MLVVDANVLWETTEFGRQAPLAQALVRRDPVWAAPRFWESEVRNICATLLRAKQLSLSRALEAVEEVRELLDGEDYVPDGRRVLELSYQSGRSAYDCEYVALAESQGVRLVTFDQTLIRAFPAVAISPRDFLARPA